MTPLLQGHRISHSLGTKTLFKSLDISINEGDKIGLVGHNGSGKSTLLAILSQELDADEGEISRNRGLQLEVVEQFINPGLSNQSLVNALADKLPKEEKDFNQYRVEQLLTELGFSPAEYEYRVADLSGGQQNRLMFARAVINTPNLILFDEPTNHLDLKTLLFFERFLQQLNAGFLLISHDRQFLDAVTERTVFLRDEKIYNFNLPYTAAKKHLDAQDNAANARLKEEEKAIKSLTNSAKRLATWGKVYDNEKFAAKAKSMEKRIEKMEENKTFVSKGSKLHLDLEMQATRANRMLHINKRDILSPGTKPVTLFHIEEFFIRPGDRIALLGHNGTGKTTLIKLIMDQFATDRDGDLVKFNPQCEIGYYDQEINEFDGSLNLVETLRARCHRGSETDYKTALIKAGFPYPDITKKVAVLSGGEKARLMFLIIKINQPNFLVLDEPTNHIDIQGKEQLEKQILATNATLLVTSHDRRFIDHIADRFVLIEDRQLIEINSPDSFYQTDTSQIPGASNTPSAHTITPGQITDEDSILERIIELETLIAEDQARKIKFQKPKIQAEWHIELEKLNIQLISISK
ncbi:MAG: ABC-F family ATP-binding cassette domain-containing protein [Gammaproteobacteria bacterium]|jgi:ATP-binding cassette, subfamily F, member 3|nr:ABC-F family ATP-binding cassette domain-containing protein [Gammaproteobacteria bacterium]MBT5202424.1 ABC-F family ATP-binding cassette domain-containing protein [Gammaproteobacteria bacterium]MBT6244906.1 ABC-F family ATP-binding cassette domain-containing protein [Gammaproteobacteria bacterium]